MRGCPYCPYESDVKSAGKHVIRQHPKKPHPSDEGWPGWRDTEASPNGGDSLGFVSYQ